MKTTKKVLALILSLLMLLSLAVPVAGAETGPGPANPNPRITINNPVEGREYTAYKIFDVIYASDKSAYAYTISNTSEWFTNINTYASDASKGLTLTPTKANPAVFNVSVDKNKFSAAEFAAYLKENIPNTTVEGSDVPTPISGIPFEADHGNSIIADVSSFGYYFVTSNNGSLCNLTTADPTVSIVDKDNIKFDKKIDYTDVDVGDVVTYKIRGAMPSVAGYSKYDYKVTDDFPDGITFDTTEKITLKIWGETISLSENTSPDSTLEDKQYRYKYKNIDGEQVINGFELYLDLANGTYSRYRVDTSIEIVYKAEVNKRATKGAAGNINTAKLEYSNDPKVESDKGTITDKEVFYTVDLEILKHKTDHPETKLSGATFILYRKRSETLYEYYVRDETTKDVTWVTNSELATPLTTTDSGTVIFEGIQVNKVNNFDYFEYFIRETAAPEGYNLLEDDIKVTIARTEGEAILAGDEKIGDTKASTITMTATTKNGTENVPMEDAKINVANSSGSKLPETGGIGTTIFYVAGGAMMLVAVVLLVTKKKMAGKK